jgi:hypothetical protein
MEFCLPMLVSNARSGDQSCSNITTLHGKRLQHHTKFKYYNTAWSKTTTSYKVPVFSHPCDLTTKDHKDQPEHKDHHKEVSQFLVAKNDACVWEHKHHSKEVPLLLQWHLQFFLTYITYIEACLFSDQVLYLCFSPFDHHHHYHPPPFGNGSRHL